MQAGSRPDGLVRGVPDTCPQGWSAGTVKGHLDVAPLFAGMVSSSTPYHRRGELLAKDDLGEVVAEDDLGETMVVGRAI
jgi:hypothetical protein